MKVQQALWIAAIWGAPAVCVAAAETPSATTPPPAPATQPVAPTTQPIDPHLRSLLLRLGDTDAQVREEATAKLRAMGKAARPALTSMADTDDPEVRTRVLELLRQLDRRLPPEEAPRGKGGISTSSSKMTIAGNSKSVEVLENGRKVAIHQVASGEIEMSVDGFREGKEASETYKAKNADELKADNPEAYVLYEKYMGGGGPGWKPGGAFGVPQLGIIGRRVGPNRADMAAAREQMLRQMRDANVPAEQLEQVKEQLKRLEDVQPDPLLRPAPATRPGGVRNEAPPEQGPGLEELGQRNQDLRLQLHAAQERQKAAHAEPGTKPTN